MHGELVGICDDCLEIPQDLTFSEHWSVLLVKDIEPVYHMPLVIVITKRWDLNRLTELATTQHYNMPCFRVCLHSASPFSRYPCCTKQPGVLVHVEWYASHGVRLELACAKVMNEA